MMLTKYRYGFNGKENDDETSTQDYGMRIYNPALGRFLSVDPITAKYPELTPYQFASNTPIQAIDLDGLEEYHYSLTLKEDGTPVLKLINIVTEKVGVLGIKYDVQFWEGAVIVVHYNGGTYTFGGAGPANQDGFKNGNELFNEFVKDPNNKKWQTDEQIVDFQEEVLNTTSIVHWVSKLFTPKTTAVDPTSGNKNNTTPPDNTPNKESQNTSTTPEKLSKVEKSKKTEKLGDYTKTTETKPGKGPGQSRAEYVKYKNGKGKTVKMYKDSYDRANKFQHRKQKYP